MQKAAVAHAERTRILAVVVDTVQEHRVFEPFLVLRQFFLVRFDLHQGRLQSTVLLLRLGVGLLKLVLLAFDVPDGVGHRHHRDRHVRAVIRSA